MTLLPAHNARLKKVEGSGLSVDEGGEYVGGADSAKWEGDTAAFLGHRMIEDVEGPEGRRRITQVRQDRLTFELAPLLAAGYTSEDAVKISDSLTYEHEGQTKRRPAREVDPNDLIGVVRVYF